MRKVLIVTDAWHPQINGVVRSLTEIGKQAEEFGFAVEYLTPRGFHSIAMPGYAEIRLALATPAQIAQEIERAAPDCIHIATEGPLGLLARRYCLKRGRKFTTSYHTRFPEYLSARLPVPSWPVAALMRLFHGAAAATMVSTQSLEDDLRAQGYGNLLRWSRGVDASLFHPGKAVRLPFTRPVFLYAGRVAVEKNIEAFLSLDLPGTKLIVGDGPERTALEASYPEAHFAGAQEGEALARYFASADAFVFPSLTDTFGVVLLEALASGVPVAAFPVAGPRDVIGASNAGALDRDLRRAALAALDIPRERCRNHALQFSWRESARQFFGNLLLANGMGALHENPQEAA
ncbi:MAG TPA: glycosyltransferase family 1 protein [Xanthobacteraceae bacterium]|nr:glycosyltransferase family 1 protein [Xanthobacteraceae bacterium]